MSSLALSTKDYEPDDVTSEELEEVEKLRASILKAQGRTEPLPAHATHFRRAILLRFLRARRSVKSPLEASTKMFLDMIEWYHESYGFEAKVLAWGRDQSSEAKLIRKWWPCGPFGVDRRQAPVFYGRYGLADIAGLERETSFDHFIQHACFGQHTMEHLMNAAADSTGKHPVKIVCVLDLQGIEWGRAARNIPTFNKQVMAQMLDANFPERLFVCLVVRAPWIFSALYKLISPVLDANTREKVHILGRNEDHKAAIGKYVDPAQVPDWLGGGATDCEIPEGGTVPNTKKAAASADGGDEAAAACPDEDGFMQVKVAAGTTYDAEFEVAVGESVAYGVKLQAFDVDFEVVLQPAAGGAEKVLVSKTRVAVADTAADGEKGAAGTFEVDCAGTLRLRFDNSYSWTRSKTVLYRVG